MPILHKDMQVCISLAARPSNIGTRFHNFLYDELGLDFVYKAFTTTDLPGAVTGIRALGIRGCSVSMPFKEAIIPLVDVVEESAAAIQSINTVVNDDGVLTASNTDYEAVASLLRTHEVDPSARVVLRGSGGMAKAVTAAFRGAGFEQLTVVARNAETGSALAEQYGFDWVETEQAAPDADVLVNVTPLGMRGADEDALAFAQDRVRGPGRGRDHRLRRGRVPLRDPAGPGRSRRRCARDHRRRGHRAAGSAPVRAVHGRRPDGRPGASSERVQSRRVTVRG